MKRKGYLMSVAVAVLVAMGFLMGSSPAANADTGFKEWDGTFPTSGHQWVIFGDPDWCGQEDPEHCEEGFTPRTLQQGADIAWQEFDEGLGSAGHVVPQWKTLDDVMQEHMLPGNYYTPSCLSGSQSVMRFRIGLVGPQGIDWSYTGPEATVGSLKQALQEEIDSGRGSTYYRNVLQQTWRGVGLTALPDDAPVSHACVWGDFEQSCPYGSRNAGSILSNVYYRFPQQTWNDWCNPPKMETYREEAYDYDADPQSKVITGKYGWITSIDKNSENVGPHTFTKQEVTKLTSFGQHLNDFLKDQPRACIDGRNSTICNNPSGWSYEWVVNSLEDSNSHDDADRHAVIPEITDENKEDMYEGGVYDVKEQTVTQAVEVKKHLDRFKSRTRWAMEHYNMDGSLAFSEDRYTDWEYNSYGDKEYVTLDAFGRNAMYTNKWQWLSVRCNSGGFQQAVYDQGLENVDPNWKQWEPYWGGAWTPAYSPNDRLKDYWGENATSSVDTYDEGFFNKACATDGQRYTAVDTEGRESHGKINPTFDRDNEWNDVQIPLFKPWGAVSGHEVPWDTQPGDGLQPTGLTVARWNGSELRFNNVLNWRAKTCDDRWSEEFLWDVPTANVHMENFDTWNEVHAVDLGQLKGCFTGDMQIRSGWASRGGAPEVFTFMWNFEPTMWFMAPGRDVGFGGVNGDRSMIEGRAKRGIEVRVYSATRGDTTTVDQKAFERCSGSTGEDCIGQGYLIPGGEKTPERTWADEDPFNANTKEPHPDRVDARYFPFRFTRSSTE